MTELEEIKDVFTKIGVSFSVCKWYDEDEDKTKGTKVYCGAYHYIEDEHEFELYFNTEGQLMDKVRNF